MKHYYLFVLILFGYLITSCALDDDTDVKHVELGIIKGTNSSTFTIQTDGNLVLRPVEYPSGYKIEEGKRVVVQYSVIKTAQDEASYDYTVRALNIQNVLTKNILEATEEVRDTLTNDPVQIWGVWIAQSFLNIEFSFYAYNRSHFFDLVYDPEIQADSDGVLLKFNHNANNDPDLDNYRAIISFSLTSLQDSAEDSVKIFFSAHDSYYTSPKELIYKW